MLASNTLLQAPDARKGEKTGSGANYWCIFMGVPKVSNKCRNKLLEEPETPMVPKRSKKGPRSLFTGTWCGLRPPTPREAAAEGFLDFSLSFVVPLGSHLIVLVTPKRLLGVLVDHFGTPIEIY